MHPSMIYMKLIVFVNLMNIAFCQNFVERPSDVTIREGETALFRCIITNILPEQSVYWFRSSTRQFLTVDNSVLDTPQRDRLAVLGDAGRGEYFLQIRGTILSDEGTYRCGYAVPNMAFTSHRAELVVLRPPNRGFPICEVSPLDLGIGDNAALTCRSEGGNPPALLAWSAGPERLTDQKESQNILSIAVSGEHNGLEFVCTATSQALDDPRMCAVTLISIPPDVRVEPSLKTAEVGERAVFTCVAFGLPTIIRYEWQFNNKPVDDIPRIEVSGDERTLIINDIEQSDDETAVLCTAVTTHGLSSAASGVLRVVARNEMTIPPTMNETTGFYNATMDDEELTGKPSPLIIAVIVISVLVGQVLIIMLVYVLHRFANRMMKERKARRGPPPIRKPTELKENVYVGDKHEHSPPSIDPETGAPTIPNDAIYSDSPSMGEAIYTGTPQTPPPTNSPYATVSNEPPTTPPPSQNSASNPTLPISSHAPPVYSNLTDLEQTASGSPSTVPRPQSPTAPSESAYGYADVPFVEELEVHRRPPAPDSTPPSRPVTITSPPPNKIPPRLPANKRQPPKHSPYLGLNPDRSESQYLSLRHYDDVYSGQALREGARLNGEEYCPVEHDDDGYVYELPPTESGEGVYDLPPDAAEKREYTFMGRNPVAQ